MKRFAALWTLLAAVLSAALLGAGPNDSNGFPAPSVVVYPLTGTAQTPSEAGGNIALLISTRLSQLGGVTVKPALPGTQRAQFLSAAVTAGADYYITGFLTPVGSDVSMIVQVVSVQSGSVVYSNTSTVKTYSDVLTQADPVRDAMLNHAGRGLPSVQQVNSSATTAPTVSGGAVNLTKALGRHRGVAAAGPPLPWGLIVDVDGGAPADQKRLTQQTFALDLHPLGLQGQILPVSAAEASKNSASICKANPASVAFFLMSLENTGSDVNVSVSAIGCDGAALGTQTASHAVTGKSPSPAIVAATAATASSFAAAIKTLTAPKPAGT